MEYMKAGQDNSKSGIKETMVVLYQCPDSVYPDAPFHPSDDFPEYPFKGLKSKIPNRIYRSIREIFRYLCMDIDNYDTSSWNPLGELIQPGDHVLIKPNLVRHIHLLGKELTSVVTHGSIIRAVLDYVSIALKGKGTITIGDAPLQTTDFEQLLHLTGLVQVVKFYHNHSDIEIKVVDFRRERAEKDGKGIVFSRLSLVGDPLGYTTIDLGSESKLAEVSSRFRGFRVTNYNPDEMTLHHNLRRHEYLVANSVLSADVVINLPKLKTHKKAGVTISLKNIIGINGSKDWLPHHTVGSSEEGGDEYRFKDLRKRVLSKLTDVIERTKSKTWRDLAYFAWRSLYFTRHIFPYKDKYFEGDWYGNDTTWRTILDSNRILLYANKKGEIQPIIQRKYFSLVDGVIAGEGEGPMATTPKKCGVIAAGFEPAILDAICSCLMGFDWRKIPSIRNALDQKLFSPFSLNDIKLVSNSPRWLSLSGIIDANLQFRPSNGWRDYVELQKKST